MEIEEALEIVEKHKRETEKRAWDKLLKRIQEIEEEDKVKIFIEPITYQPQITIKAL